MSNRYLTFAAIEQEDWLANDGDSSRRRRNFDLNSAVRHYKKAKLENIKGLIKTQARNTVEMYTFRFGRFGMKQG